MSNDFIYEMISAKVVEQLEKGIVPWRKPWTENTMPRSIRGHVYRGINVFILMSAGYESPYWMTRKMVTERGGHIKQGEHGTTIIFWKMLLIRDKLTDEVSTIPHLQYYRVWNWEQTEGCRQPKGGAFPAKADDAELVREDRHDLAAALVLGYKDGPSVSHQGDRACYYPARDHIDVPDVERFTSLDEYYSTLFHELGHSTGHQTRCDRKSSYVFGSHSYGTEELCAEMTSTFLCSKAGIVSTFDNSASYLSGWIQNIKEDPKSLVRAGAQAQRAYDWILGDAHTDSATETELAELAA